MPEMKLGVDSGQMAVMAANDVASGFSRHIDTFANAGQRFKCWTLVANHRAHFLAVADVTALPEVEALGWLEAGDGFDLNELGEFVFDVKTSLVVCDPCYVRSNDPKDHLRRTEAYIRICNLPSTGGMVVGNDGSTIGASTNTCWGDGIYTAYYDLHPDGALKYVMVDFIWEEDS